MRTFNVIFIFLLCNTQNLVDEILQWMELFLCAENFIFQFIPSNKDVIVSTEYTQYNHFLEWWSCVDL